MFAPLAGPQRFQGMRKYCPTRQGLQDVVAKGNRTVDKPRSLDAVRGLTTFQMCAKHETLRGAIFLPTAAIFCCTFSKRSLRDSVEFLQVKG